MKSLILKLFFLSLMTMIWGSGCFSQTLISDNRVEITLRDQTTIILYPGIAEVGTYIPYYYLPVNLRISIKKGIPEFSFMSYDENDDGLIDGAIMHMLLTWGLTDLQKDEAEVVLRTRYDSATFIAGTPVLSVLDNTGLFITYADNPIGEILINSLKSKGSVPFSPGEKIALSCKFSAEDAHKVESALNNTEGLKGISFNIKYSVSGIDNLNKVILRGDFNKMIDQVRK